MSLTDKEYMRYNRHIMVDEIGEAGQLAFKNAHVLIVGMGGLGCPASQYLATAGIGHLTLVDHDDIEITNLQRQILYSDFDLGEAKVEVAQQQLESLNPHCQIDSLKESIFDIDLTTILAGVDVVLDCTDSAKTRQYINACSVKAKVKLVSAAAIRGSGQLTSFDFSLAKSPCYHCLHPDLDEQQLNCANMGVMGPLLGVMGSMQAIETLRLLLGKQDNIGRLLLFDAFTMQFQQFSLPKRDNCPVCG
ncbi:molybdopterin-synthase adenylyltransferase MoeB [Thalassotalea sp. Y01]|uniref:HesA/MoeB/ThiF family protein n=1 Tax=Thalassotalea sp. Y01 TaxID=2729613 RepID=UPI00145F652B|nr:molybdopterin-synthase adenylyltransferase MoeB [Thalassotalea sp. Y01]NMP16925.1 molybdopterin-synthase adenylyltransferase MoeB [Thalassotalea sp. Y01]